MDLSPGRCQAPEAPACVAALVGIATPHAPAAQELAILRVWPFERVCVDVFNIENQPPNGESSILRPLQVRVRVRGLRDWLHAHRRPPRAEHPNTRRAQELLEPHGYRHLVRIGVDEVFRRQPPCEAEAGREPPPRFRGGRHRRSQ